MPKLLLASNNLGKIREMHAILQEIDWEILTPADMGIQMEIQEVGSTYAENASLKALSLARRSGILSLGDDSGLEVEALSGAPGLHSRRFLPDPQATDTDRRIYLLEKLAEFPRPWLAHFHCTLALAAPEGVVQLSTGDCWGEIIPQERGDSGFGYDPIFFLPEMGKTMAELTLEEKNQVSHRARALRAAIPALLEIR
jgi:XTP/dITP diphosphohydrolase